MKDQTKTKEQLIDELSGLRRRVAELEAVETERKQAEEALRGALAELTVIQQNVPIAMMLVDSDRRVHKVNEAASLFAGRPGEEMLGLRSGEALRCLHHLDDPQGCGFGPACATCAVRLAVLDTFATHESKRDVETWMPFPRGDSVEERCLLMSTAYLQMDDTERVLICAQDITERKRAERELQRSSDLLRAIIEAAPTAIIGLDLDGNVQMVWNPAAEKMLGWSAQEVMGHFLPSVPIESQEEFRGFREWIRSGETLDGVEVRQQRRDGSPIDYSIYASPLRDAEGRTIGNIAVLVDITARKRAEETLRASEEQLQLALDAAQMGQWDWNIVTGEVVWSQQCLALYGLPPDTPMSYERFLQALHPEDRERVDAALSQAVKDRTSYDEPKRTIWPDGSIHWTASRGQVYCDATGQPIRMIGVTFDITKPKEAEEALQKSHEELRAFFSQTIDGCFFMMLDEPVRWDETINQEAVLDYIFAHQHITQINEAMLAQYGATREQMLKRTPNDFFEHNPAHGRDLWRRLFDAGKIHLESDERKLDGTPMWIEGEYIVLYNSEGRITGHFGIQRDITERKRSEEAYRASVSRFRELFNKAAIPLCFISKERETLHFNAHFEKTFSYSHEEVPTINEWWQLAYPDPVYRERVIDTCNAAIQRAVETESNIEPIEYRVTCKNGDVRTMVIYGSFIGDELLLTFFDITERVRAEKALRQREQEFKTLVEHNPDMVARFDRECRHIYVNPAVEKELGVPPQAFLGKTYRELGMPAEQADWSEEIIRQVLERGQERVFETVIPTNEGVKHYLTRGVPEFAENGSVASALFIHRNVTERMQAEEELRHYREHLEELVEERTRELEQAQAELLRQERLSTLGLLMATIAHEIRNPLGTVRTAVFAIGEAIKRDQTDRVERGLQLAERNIVRCDCIIGELLDYAHDRTLGLVPTHVDTWLETVLDEQDIPQDIVCIKELNCGVEISMDRDHLRRAVVNVVSNAVDALRDDAAQGNQLTVSTHVVGDPTGSRLEIRVRDTGPGIPDDVLPRILEPLFSTKGFGAGLGLPIVKNIMEQHHGDIEIQSEVGEGTTVILWLPA